MKRIAFIVLLVSVGLVGYAQQNSERQPQRILVEDDIDSLWYNRNTVTMEASVIASKFIKKGRTQPYPQNSLTIPATVSKEVVSGSGASSTSTFKVTSIAASAFANAKASSVVFAEPSNVASIGTLAFSSMANMAGKLILPASLTSLAVSSILLPNITEIEFLGSEPPTCEISEGYNPWTSATDSTKCGIKITVPTGAKTAYQAAAGIGDYFTCLKGTTTALDQLPDSTFDRFTKIIKDGHLYILRGGKKYTLQGAEVK